MPSTVFDPVAPWPTGWGVEDYRFLVTGHPIANLTDAELDARADRLVERVIAFFAAGRSN